VISSRFEYISSLSAPFEITIASNPPARISSAVVVAGKRVTANPHFTNAFTILFFAPRSRNASLGPSALISLAGMCNHIYIPEFY